MFHVTACGRTGFMLAQALRGPSDTRATTFHVECRSTELKHSVTAVVIIPELDSIPGQYLAVYTDFSLRADPALIGTIA